LTDSRDCLRPIVSLPRRASAVPREIRHMARAALVVISVAASLPTPMLAQQPPETAAQQRMAAIRQSDIRSGPDVIGLVRPGEVVTVREISGSWAAVEHGVLGWVAIADLRDVETATELFGGELEKQEAAVDAHLALARLYRDTSRPRQALAQVNAALKLQPDHGGALLLRGNLWLAQSQRDRNHALRDIASALRIQPELPQAYRLRGRVWLFSGEEDRALDDLNRAVELAPDDAASYLGRGRVRLQRGELVHAVADFSAALRLEPQSAEALLGRGKARLAAGNVQQAAEDFSRAIRYQPHHVAPYYERARLRATTGQPEAALEDLSAAIELDGEHRDALELRGDIWLELSEYELAIRDFSRALELSQQHASVFRKRGKVWYDAGKYDRALEDFNRAILLDPNAADVFAWRARIHIQREAFDQAEADLAACEKFLADDPQWLEARGMVRAQRGEFEQALADFQQSWNLDRKRVSTRINMAWVWATCPDIEIRSGTKALDQAERACEATDYRDPLALEALAAAHAELEEFDEAVRWQLRALDAGELEDLPPMRQRLADYRVSKATRSKVRFETALQSTITLDESALESEQLPARVALVRRRASSVDEAVAQLAKVQADASPAADAAAEADEKTQAADAGDDQPLPPDDQQAIAALEELGAQIGRSENGRVLSVNLRYQQFSDRDMELLDGLPALEVLNLTFTQITDRGVAKIAGIRRLKALSLDQTRVTDKGFAALGDLPQMEVLNLNATELTDASVEVLKKLQTLKILVISNCGFSDQGLAALRAALPDTEITE